MSLSTHPTTPSQWHRSDCTSNAPGALGPRQHLGHPKPHLPHSTRTCTPEDSPKHWIIDLGWPECPRLNQRSARSTKHSRFRARLTRAASSLLHAHSHLQLHQPHCTRRICTALPALGGSGTPPGQHSHMHLATNSQTREFGPAESPSWVQNARLSPQLHLPHLAMGQIPTWAPLSSGWVKVGHGDSIPQLGKAPLPERSGASRASE